MLSASSSSNYLLPAGVFVRKERAASVGLVPSGTYLTPPRLDPNGYNNALDANRPRSALDTFDGSLRRRSTRRRYSTRRKLSQAQKAINFNQWSNKKVQASDGYFFEQFSTTADGGSGAEPSNFCPLSTTNDRHTSLCAVPQQPNGSAAHSSSAENQSPSQLNDRLSRFSFGDELWHSLDDLYVEAMYTIVHKIGRADPVGEHESICYAQKAFHMDEKRHYELMDVARREKARDLIAKDINGFSDPFAMMGIIPGQKPRRSARDGESVTGRSNVTSVNSLGSTRIDENGVDELPPMSPSAFSSNQRRVERSGSGGSAHGVLQRFGGSFRRKIGAGSGSGGSNKRILRPYSNDGIPVKLIKASSVQHKTLNPKWSEKFQFVVDDANNDKFHMDIWDHDDEDRSVLDAVALLNQVSGLKGLGRYFKEVTQSARAGSNELVDDFLGSVTIRLKDLPPTGLEDWFVLEKRSDKSEVSGQVRLKIWLSTKEERRRPSTVSERELTDEETLDVRQHVGLIKQFAFHEIRQCGQPINAFHGVLSESAENILSQHAIQGDLGCLEQLMCQWMGYSSMIPLGISYEFLFDIMERFISKWGPLSLEKDEENLLAESFLIFNEHCNKVIIDHLRGCSTTQSTNVGNSQSTSSAADTAISLARISELETFSSMLKCLVLLRESPLYERLFPSSQPLSEEMRDRLKQCALGHFQELKEKSVGAKNNPPLLSNNHQTQVQNGSANNSSCERLLFVIRGLNEANKRVIYLDATFRQTASIDYFQSTYPEFNLHFFMFCQLLFDFIAMELISDLKNILFRPQETEQAITTVIQLHMAMNEFNTAKKSLKYPVPNKMEQIDWSPTFDKAVVKWLELARVKAFARVELSCQIDAEITSNEIRHTSSYVDVCHVIDQLIWTWEHVEVYDIILRVELTERLVATICKIAEFYTDKMMGQLAQDGFCGQLPVSLTPSLVRAFCATVNNVEQVRRVLVINERLHLDELVHVFERKLKKKAFWKIQIEQDLENEEHYLGEQIDQTVERLIQRQMTLLKKHVFHLAWSPGACPVDQSLKPLTENLDAELSTVHRTLLHRNFIRVMYAQVGLLIRLLKDCVTENTGMEPSFYQRLSEAWSILMDFFHADGKGISLEAFDQISAHRSLVSTLSLNQQPTIRLIELYYQDLLKEQTEVTDCKYGILNLRAYYNAKSQTLVIDDFLRANDFAGEALLDLVDVPGFGQAGGVSASTLRQFNLILIHPSGRAQPTVDVIASRKEDKDAQEFIRSLSYNL